MKKIVNTYEINGYHLRLDEIKTISPLYLNTANLDGVFAIFMKDIKKSYQSQYNFTITFTGKNGGYQDFYSKVVDYVGYDDKVDEGFVDDYNGLVFAWKEYHNNISGNSC